MSIDSRTKVGLNEYNHELQNTLLHVTQVVGAHNILDKNKEVNYYYLDM